MPPETEFIVPKPETLSDRVKRQFGSAPRSIVRAVARHLEKNPGALDAYNLEVIAAATPSIGDPKLVAELIDSMPVTGMHVATAEIRLPRWRTWFEEVLPHYPTLTRKRLVKSLLDESTLHVLRNVPTDRLTPVGRATYFQGIERDLHGSAHALARFAHGPHVDHELMVRVLDEVERRIVRSERGTPSRPPQKMPIDAVGGALVSILQNSHEAATEEERVRAWDLAMRCEMSQPWRHHLVDVVMYHHSLPGDALSSLLEQIDKLPVPDREAYLYGIICDPGLDEQTARKAVEMGATPVWWWRDSGDSRLAFVRFQSYGTRSGTEDLLPENISSLEIDQRIAAWANELLHDEISAIETPSVLQEICRHEEKLLPGEFSRLLRNPRLDLAAAVEVVARRKSRAPREMTDAVATLELVIDEFRKFPVVLKGSDGKPVYGFNLMMHPGMDVDTAKALIDEASTQHLKMCLLKGALHNVSRNPNPELEQYVLDVLKEQIELDRRERSGQSTIVLPEAEKLFEHLASNSSNPSVHRQLVDIAMSTNNAKIVKRLAGNAWCRRELLHETAELFPDRETTDPVSFFDNWEVGDAEGWTYHPAALAREAIENGADRFVVRTLVEGCLEGQGVDVAELRFRYKTATERSEAFHAAVEELIEHDLLTKKDWRDLVQAGDEHTAIRYITHPKCPWNATRFVSQAERDLRSTVRTIDDGMAELPARDRSLEWSDLPNATDEPLPRTALSDMIDGQTIAGMTMQTPRTERELRNVAERMGNCIAGFADGVRDGTHIVAYTHAEHRSYAAVWTVSGGNQLELYELNTSFNTNDVPVELRNGIDLLTTDVNDSHVARVAALPGADGDAVFREVVVPVAQLEPANYLESIFLEALAADDAQYRAADAEREHVHRDVVDVRPDVAETQPDVAGARLDLAGTQSDVADVRPQVVRRPPARVARIALRGDVQPAEDTETVDVSHAPSVLTTNADAVASHDQAATEVQAPEPGTQANAGHEGVGF